MMSESTVQRHHTDQQITSHFKLEGVVCRRSVAKQTTSSGTSAMQTEYISHTSSFKYTQHVHSTPGCPWYFPRESHLPLDLPVIQQ